MPKEYTRKDISSVSITCYTLKRVKIIIYGPAPEYKKLSEKIGTERWHPLTEKQFDEKGTGDIYPNYSIIAVDGIEEVFEQRKFESIIYITDDPKWTSVLNKETAQ